MYKLTKEGIKRCNEFIAECKAKRKEILDAGKDTADETELPTVEHIESDINDLGVDEAGEYFNGWAVTDNYSSDGPIGLKLGVDFIEFVEKKKYYAITTSMTFQKTVLVPVSSVADIDEAFELVDAGVEVASISLMTENADFATVSAEDTDENGMRELSEEEAAMYQILEGDGVYTE